MMQHSADYHHLDVALKSLWQPFSALLAEMDSFFPQARADYAQKEAEEIGRLKKLNPGQSEESLRIFVEGQFDFLTAPSWQFHEQFGSRLMSQYIFTALVSHAL